MARRNRTLEENVYRTTMDNACVELKYVDESVLFVYCEAVGKILADNMCQHAELNYLIYNDMFAYANLILNGDSKAYLKAVTEYKPLAYHVTL